MNIRHLIFYNIKKVKPLFLRYMACFIIASCALSINPYVTSRIIGCFNLETKEEVLQAALFWLIVYVILKLLQAANQYLASLTRATFMSVFQANLATDMFKAVHAHAASYFDDEMTGRISGAVNKVTNLISDMSTNLLFMLFRPLFNFLFAAIIIAHASPLLALTLTLLCFPFFFAIKSSISKYLACGTSALPLSVITSA